jgi:hypothetical protein
MEHVAHESIPVSVFYITVQSQEDIREVPQIANNDIAIEQFSNGHSNVEESNGEESEIDDKSNYTVTLVSNFLGQNKLYL